MLVRRDFKNVSNLRKQIRVNRQTRLHVHNYFMYNKPLLNNYRYKLLFKSSFYKSLPFLKSSLSLKFLKKDSYLFVSSKDIHLHSSVLRKNKSFHRRKKGTALLNFTFLNKRLSFKKSKLRVRLSKPSVKQSLKRKSNPRVSSFYKSIKNSSPLILEKLLFSNTVVTSPFIRSRSFKLLSSVYTKLKNVKLDNFSHGTSLRFLNKNNNLSFLNSFFNKTGLIVNSNNCFKNLTNNHTFNLYPPTDFRSLNKRLFINSSFLNLNNQPAANANRVDNSYYLLPQNRMSFTFKNLSIFFLTNIFSRKFTYLDQKYLFRKKLFSFITPGEVKNSLFFKKKKSLYNKLLLNSRFDLNSLHSGFRARNYYNSFISSKKYNPTTFKLNAVVKDVRFTRIRFKPGYQNI